MANGEFKDGRGYFEDLAARAFEATQGEPVIETRIGGSFLVYDPPGSTFWRQYADEHGLEEGDVAQT